jgi:hypothetical protein
MDSLSIYEGREPRLGISEVIIGVGISLCLEISGDFPRFV